jgi:hypothetical protein
MEAIEIDGKAHSSDAEASTANHGNLSQQFYRPKPRAFVLTANRPISRLRSDCPISLHSGH